MNYVIIILLICLSGIFSGLTLGLLSIDKEDLKRKAKLGNKKAKKVYTVRKNGNLLLCTLLIGNVAVNSALSIFLGSIVNGIIAGLLATALIVIFGEILPQAIFSRYAIELSSKIIWLVKFFIFVLYPIALPLSWVLDKILGKEMPNILSKREFKEIIKFHEDSPKSKIDTDEERIMLGALSFSDKIVRSIMTPRTVVFALDVKDILDKKNLQRIKKYGFTRIPIYDKHIDKIVGILYTKDLIGINLGVKIKDIYHKNNLIIVPENRKLDVLLNEFISKKTHIAFVFDEYGSLRGIATLEDVIEEVFGREIVDETDKIIDLQKNAKEQVKKRGLKI